jgi:dipeptidyl aminopeptidase/acylaminoacyl peptidase
MTSDTFLHQLMTLPTVVQALLSPDGCWVAFVWYRLHENFDVFVVPSDGSQPPIALTHTKEATGLISWTPDSRAVIVSEDHDGDEFARLFRVDMDKPLVMQPLTPDRPPFFLRGGKLHPNGRWLFYGANFDFSKEETVEPCWVHRQDLQTGEIATLARPLKADFAFIDLNKQGTHLIYSRRDRSASGRQFYLLDVEGKEDREILNFGDKVKAFARWLPDGENIIFTSEAVTREDFTSEATGKEPQEHISLGIYHVKDAQVRWLVDDPERGIEGFWVSPDGLVVVDEVVQANHAATFIDPQTGIETRFQPLPGNLVPLGRAADGLWVGLYYAANSPTELVRFPVDAISTADLTSLTRVWERTTLKPQELATAQGFTWKSVDGVEIHGWLYRATPAAKRAVIYIHGGPTSHSENKLNPQIQYYVRRGFNVLDVNSRGSTGYGLKFRFSIKVDGWGGREQQDIAAGAQALIEQGLAEAGKVGITGTSYGGYSSWYLITHFPPQVIAASAPVCGMTDLVVDYQTTRPDLRPYSEEMLGGRPDQVPERYYERSPINFVQDIRGKLLIVQGALDPNVSPENVRQVREKLEEHKIPYELLVFEDEGHGIGKPINQEKLYPALAEFFERAM